MMEMLANSMVAIILQYISISTQHIVPLKVIHYMSIIPQKNWMCVRSKFRTEIAYESCEWTGWRKRQFGEVTDIFC